MLPRSLRFMISVFRLKNSSALSFSVLLQLFNRGSTGPIQPGSITLFCSRLETWLTIRIQTYNYFLRFPNDKPAIKYFVSYVVLLETVGCVTTTWMIYQPLIQYFGQEIAVTRIPAGLIAEPAIVVAISTPIQIFIARRIRIFQGSPWVALAICFFSIISFAGGIWVTIATHNTRIFLPRVPIVLYESGLVWMISATVADILITLSLSWSLYKRRTGFGTTDAVIVRIVVFTVQTGLTLSLSAIATVVTAIVLPMTKNSITFVFNVTLMKLYGNFILATLNNRENWNNGLITPESQSILFPETVPSITTKPVTLIPMSFGVKDYPVSPVGLESRDI
ncbi:unnamed protein product [Cyclocybe aegerita]|uniref:DUF6534 domain-containing protein n=1 Tax=Cyclocybe aegerita TaxID=1973307 RepID=A0A8S0WP82_CYCAE|nr:unnamed protein product [Cyclocybe aegerita]